MSDINYVCIIDGLLEFASTTARDFAHYLMMYEDEIFEAEHNGAFVQMLSLTDAEFEAMFPVEDDELEDEE
jgi:hypothetical protein